MRLPDTNQTQLRIFGHFFNEHRSFVMTLEGVEKEGKYHPVGTKTWRAKTRSTVIKRLPSERSPSKDDVLFASSSPLMRPSVTGTINVGPPSSRPEWQNVEYRRAHMQESIDRGLAWQIRINRRKRGWSQSELARAMGTKQSAISRLEDPDHGACRMETLVTAAHAFDCALVVKLIPCSELALESMALSIEDQYAPSCVINGEGTDHPRPVVTLVLPTASLVQFANDLKAALDSPHFKRSYARQLMQTAKPVSAGEPLRTEADLNQAAGASRALLPDLRDSHARGRRGPGSVLEAAPTAGQVITSV